MLINLIAALGPLKLVIASLVFFNLAWLAPRKWLLYGVLAISAGELTLPWLWAQLRHLAAALAREPGLTSASSDHAASLLAVLFVNAMLASVIWVAVRILQLWAHLTLRRHEAKFLTLIRHEGAQARSLR